MNIYESLLAKAINGGGSSGGGGGGGGDSDFKSVNVTLIPTHGSDFGVYDAGYSEEPWGYHCFHLLNGQIVAGAPNGVTEETTITLYYIGDSLEVQPNNTYESSTGAVTWNPDTFTLTITGDCTITGWTSG